MRSTVGSVQVAVTRHPRLVVSVLVVSVFLAAGGVAGALDGVVGFEPTSLGDGTDVTTDGIGGSNGGPTDPDAD